MVLLDLEGASARLNGVVKRYLVEIRPGVFVGHLNSRATEQLWALVEDRCPRAAILAYPARNELGVAFKTFGCSRFQVVDCDGLPLVMRTASAK